MKLLHKKTLLILIITLVALSGCISNTPEENIAEQVPLNTEDKPNSVDESLQPPDSSSGQLALEVGFLDEQIKLAGIEGASLFYTRTTTVDDNNYAVFYLLTENEPRILNKSAMIVLVYEGNIEKIGNFIYRLEIKNYVEQDVFESLPSQVITSSALPMNDPAIIGYEAAGFTPIVTKTSSDNSGREYLASVFSFSNTAYILTYQLKPTTFFLEKFVLESFFDSNVQAMDALKVWTDGAPESLRPIKGEYFEAMEENMRPNFEPISKKQQAFYALGCNFSSETPTSIAHLEYTNGKYEIYLCTALQTSGMLIDNSSDNIIFISYEDSNSSNIIWSSYEYNSRSIAVGDTNHDNISDINIDNFFVGATYIWDSGSEIIQITNDKKLINVLYGINNQPSSVKSRESSFMDLNNDGVYEFVSKINIQFGGYDYQAYSAIYLLTDDFYYVQSDGVFDFLCIETIENLPNSLFQYEIEELLEFNAFIGESINTPDETDSYKEIAVALINCDVTGIQKQNADVFVSALNQKLPGSCRGFLYGLPKVASYTTENGTQSKRDKNYWQDIFEQSGKCQE